MNHPTTDPQCIWRTGCSNPERCRAAGHCDSRERDLVPSKTDLSALYDAFGIGRDVRTLDVLLVNIENARRRSDCLSAIEREFFTRIAIDEDGEEFDECPLSWGVNSDEYVVQFRQALAAFQPAPETGAVRPLTLQDFGYAPGGYTCACFSCGVRFSGDKRAIQCEPCAKAKLERSQVKTKARRDTGIRDLSGLRLFEGDRVRVEWTEELGIKELNCEAVGTVEYMCDKITAAWAVKFDQPYRRSVGDDGIYEAESQILVQETEIGDECLIHFVKLTVDVTASYPENGFQRCACGRNVPHPFIEGTCAPDWRPSPREDRRP